MGYFVTSNPYELEFAANNKLSFAIPINSPNEEKFKSIIKELNRDGFPYKETVNIEIGYLKYKIYNLNL